jgi:uncharacterized protein (TIGR02271 family)
MSTTVVGLYRTEADVDHVSDELARAGFDRHDITRPAETDPDLANWLVDRGVPEREAAEYEQGVLAGGTLLTLEADDDRAAEAVQIMERHAHAAAGAGAGSAHAVHQGAGMQREAAMHRETKTDLGADTHRSGAAARSVEGEESIPVVEEDLEVGTRAVEGGGVRVHTFVTEKPVDAQVRVRDERVTVDRRPVDRPLGAGDLDDAFQERTVEMNERTEDVVVGKTARVVEEVVVGKDVDERTETVTDTVRKTGVEVERADDLETDEHRLDGTGYGDALSDDDEDFDEHDPAYRYGVDLADHPEYRGRPWGEIAPTVREGWVRTQGDTWLESERSVRRGYERTASRGRR